MTGPDRPVRQPPNTRASILRTGFLRLAAFPWMPETRTFISARGGADRERRMLRARPMRTIPSSTFQGRFQLPRHDPVGGSSGRSIVHTPRHGETGRPRAAQFAPWAVYIPGGGTTWCGRKGAQDGDSRSALTGTGRRWRGVPRADRATPVRSTHRGSGRRDRQGIPGGRRLGARRIPVQRCLVDLADFPNWLCAAAGVK
jgi:hypothetical protein